MNEQKKDLLIDKYMIKSSDDLKRTKTRDLYFIVTVYTNKLIELEKINILTNEQKIECKVLKLTIEQAKFQISRNEYNRQIWFWLLPLFVAIASLIIAVVAILE